VGYNAVPLTINRRCGGTRLLLHSRRRNIARNLHEAGGEQRIAGCVLAGFFAWRTLRPERWRRLVPLERRTIFNGLSAVSYIPEDRTPSVKFSYMFTGKTTLPAETALYVLQHPVVLYRSLVYICTCIYVHIYIDRLCGLVVRVLGYRSLGPGSIPGTTRKKK
jgi:hypothetical protein